MKKIYCDGSSKNNGRENCVGAWAYVIIDENNNIIKSEKQAQENVTNQRMELCAAAKALESFQELFPNEQCLLHTDSAYLHNCFKDKWYVNWQRKGWINSRKEPVAHKDLWIRIIPFFNNPNFYFTKVTAHKNDKWNNIVDKMAQAEADSFINE